MSGGYFATCGRETRGQVAKNGHLRKRANQFDTSLTSLFVVVPLPLSSLHFFNSLSLFLLHITSCSSPNSVSYETQQQHQHQNHQHKTTQSTTTTRKTTPLTTATTTTTKPTTATNSQVIPRQPRDSKCQTFF